MHCILKRVTKGNPGTIGNAMQVGMVIDLTNTWRYYDVEEWTTQGVEHCKVSTNPPPLIVCYLIAHPTSFLRRIRWPCAVVARCRVQRL